MSFPVVIAVPALYPKAEFLDPDVIESPAFVPATVLPDPSLDSPASTSAQVRPPVLPD